MNNKIQMMMNKIQMNNNKIYSKFLYMNILYKNYKMLWMNKY